MPAIETHGLTKTFKGLRAVDGIDLTVHEGETVALLGPNGAGKTTTIFMLLGLTEPDEGWVRLLDHPMPAERAEALAKCNFAATYLGLPYRMTVREIFEVYADIYRVSYDRISNVAELFAVEHLLGRQSKDMSSGQRTLVVLARALLNRPQLLILDEPTASLDPEIAQQVRTVLGRVHAETGCTLLITSHNMHDIERLCDRVVFIANGRVVADSSPNDLIALHGVSNLEETFLEIAASARARQTEPPLEEVRA